MNDTFEGEQYAYVPSNLSCWYAKSGDNIEVKLKTNPPATKCAELTTRVAYVLCQKVTLSAIEVYSLSYDLLCPPGITNLKLSVTLNGALVSTLNISAAG